MDHGDDGLDTLQFVPLVALHGQLVLVCWGSQRAHTDTFIVIHATLEFGETRLFGVLVTLLAQKVWTNARRF